jgi:hypothetical protein
VASIGALAAAGTDTLTANKIIKAATSRWILILRMLGTPCFTPCPGG